MHDLVLVPSYYRPEYLALCLAHLAEADGGGAKEVWISQDHHDSDRPEQRLELALVEEVVERFRGAFAALRWTERAPHSTIGNNLNFLELYREAHASDARFVYLVEEDVLVAPDFFRWHEAVQARGDYFCTVGWCCVRNPGFRASTDPTAYIETSCDYSSIGVCWRRERLAPVVRHARAEYYRDHERYLQQHFPESPIPAAQWTEQAGLIMRVLLDARDREVVVWPSLPRCAHVGVQGYHRRKGHRFTGALTERIAALREAARSTEGLMALCAESVEDVQALQERARPMEWSPEELHVAQRFRWEGRL